jgi:NADPH:quinone reductase-like Zn-dependent oxidoreductase
MKAIRNETYGPPETLQFKEVEKPVPKSHQVLVKVHAASINALEWRRYTMPSILSRIITGGWLKPKDTLIGTDVAGRVEAVGENITRFKPGDDVFGFAHGSFAEYVLAREVYLTLKPANRSFEEAAAVPIAGLTALQAIYRAGRIQPGARVLIQGASGGIGMYLIQLAKSYGAEVTAVCSTRNLDLACSWGADHAVDYTKDDFTQSGKQYDLIFGVNGYRSLSAYRGALKSQGLYLCVGGAIRQIFEVILFGKWFSQKGGRTLRNMGVSKINQDDLAILGGLLQEGKLAPAIDRCYPLHETVSAFRYIIEKHAQGKVIIQVLKG